MYILTINYLNGTTHVSSHANFPRVQEAVSIITELVDSLEIRHQVENDDDLTTGFNGNYSASWGI